MLYHYKDLNLDRLKPRIQRTLADTPISRPCVYMCPYADPQAGDYDYSVACLPSNGTLYDLNVAFFTLSEDKVSGTYGNGVDTTYLTHLRNLSAIRQIVKKLQAAGHEIDVSYIDTPNIHWDSANIPNYVRNTEGEFDADGEIISNDLMENFNPVGRMWDIETEDSAALALTKLMKACFLQGILRDPNYVFIYTTYANRSIDETILTSAIDPNGDEVDQALYKLGFTTFSDLITKRGSLSRLETMSYSSTAQELKDEADAYARQLGGPSSSLNDMRKFISIGVAPGLTDPSVALEIAAACDPTKPDGYRGFMVWAGNCPAGVSLFEAMDAVSKNPELALTIDRSTLPAQKLPPGIRGLGNKEQLLAKVAEQPCVLTTQVTDNPNQFFTRPSDQPAGIPDQTGSVCSVM